MLNDQLVDGQNGLRNRLSTVIQPGLMSWPYILVLYIDLIARSCSQQTGLHTGLHSENDVTANVACDLKSKWTIASL